MFPRMLRFCSWTNLIWLISFWTATCCSTGTLKLAMSSFICYSLKFKSSMIFKTLVVMLFELRQIISISLYPKVVANKNINTRHRKSPLRSLRRYLAGQGGCAGGGSWSGGWRCEWWHLPCLRSQAPAECVPHSSAFPTRFASWASKDSQSLGSTSRIHWQSLDQTKNWTLGTSWTAQNV